MKSTTAKTMTAATCIDASGNRRGPGASTGVNAHRGLHERPCGFEERLIELAFAALANSPVNALIVTTDAFIATRKPEIIALVSSQRLPTIYPWREWTELGGLMSYGADTLDAYRLTGVYAGKILRGAKPVDLPVEQSVKFQLALNLKTAKSLGLEIPPTLLARADEVIE